VAHGRKLLEVGLARVPIQRLPGGVATMPPVSLA